MTETTQSKAEQEVRVYYYRFDFMYDPERVDLDSLCTMVGYYLTRSLGHTWGVRFRDEDDIEDPDLYEAYRTGELAAGSFKIDPPFTFSTLTMETILAIQEACLSAIASSQEAEHMFVNGFGDMYYDANPNETQWEPLDTTTGALIETDSAMDDMAVQRLQLVMYLPINWSVIQWEALRIDIGSELPRSWRWDDETSSPSARFSGDVHRYQMVLSYRSGEADTSQIVEAWEACLRGVRKYIKSHPEAVIWLPGAIGQMNGRLAENPGAWHVIAPPRSLFNG